MNSVARNYQAGAQRANAPGRLQANASHQHGPDNFTSAQKNINSAILEYLLKYGYMKTVD